MLDGHRFSSSVSLNINCRAEDVLSEMLIKQHRRLLPALIQITSLAGRHQCYSLFSNIASDVLQVHTS